MVERRPRRVDRPGEQYPHCPDCGTDRWVQGCQQPFDWACVDCGRRFDDAEAASPVPWGPRR